MTTEATGIPIPQLDNREPVKDDLPGLATPPAPAAGETPPKRRRRRGPNKAKATEPVTAPVQDPATAQKELDDLANAMSLGFKMGGKVAAAVRGNHWLITDDEADNLGNAWAVALAPYMGRLAPYMPFVTAVIVTGGIVAPRVTADRALRQGNPPPLAAPTTERALTVIPRMESPATPQAEVPQVPPVDRPDLEGNERGFPPSPPLDGSVAARRTSRRSATPPAT